MDWDPAERDAWVADAERWIGQIKGVLQCKIDLDEDGEVAGVHVVAGIDREPRHIVRDVEGLLKARLDLDVYYKKIGVVQVVDDGTLAEVALGGDDRTGTAYDDVAAADGPANGPPTRAEDDVAAGRAHAPEHATATATAEQAPPSRQPEPAPPRPAVLVAEGLGTRVVCTEVAVTVADTVVRVAVGLRVGAGEARAVREAPNHAGSDVRLVAEASLAALGELIEDPVLLHLREVRLDTVGDRPLVLTAVDLVEGRRTEVLFGSCSAGHNRQQAVVHAVLDALNRRLALLALRTAAANAAAG